MCGYVMGVWDHHTEAEESGSDSLLSGMNDGQSFPISGCLSPPLAAGRTKHIKAKDQGALAS